MIAANASPIPIINIPLFLFNRVDDDWNRKDSEHPINKKRWEIISWGLSLSSMNLIDTIEKNKILSNETV